MDQRKKIIIFSILGVLVIGLFVFLFLLWSNRIVDDNSGFILIDNLEAGVYSEKKVSDYIKKIDGKIIDDQKISTHTLGKQKVQFLYYNKNKKKRRGTFNVTVKDLEEPLIWLSDRYYVKRGNDLDLVEEIMCVDNYDSNPNCRIEGDYDLNQVGNYPLSFVATDHSKNENRVDFTLYVYEPKKSSGVSYPQELTETAFTEVVKNYKQDNNEIGIDVSKWQEDIDFSKVKQAGATFVMIRVGSQKGVGEEYVLDPYFQKNIESALKNNLKVGVYFYSYADSNKEAKKQAKWVLKQVENYDLDLPIVFDWECYSSLNQMELSLFGLNQVAESFLQTIEKAGYTPMLYGSKNYLNSIWKYHTYPVWLAHYTSKTDYDSDYEIWQLCQDGVIDGIKGQVDIDILYKK